MKQSPRQETKKLHVTFGSSKRIVHFKAGEKVEHLRHHFLRVFSDVLSDEVAPPNVTFQSYDNSFDDYIDLANNTELEENTRVKALIIFKNAAKSSSCWKDQNRENCFSDVCHHWEFPMYVTNNLEPSDLKFHPINQDTPYRIWNIASNGLIQRDPGDQTLITCKGGFSSNNNDTVVKAKHVGQNVFYLVFESSSNSSYITPTGGGQRVTLESNPTEQAKFEPDYYWGHTMFKSSYYTKLYLGCDDNRIATLVPMDTPTYPNPQGLFIIMGITLSGPQAAEKLTRRSVVAKARDWVKK